MALTPSAFADDDDNTAAELPDWQIEDAILEAEGSIDAVLKSRYTITTYELEEENPENPGEIWVTTVAPPPVRGWTRDIAAFLAALTFRKNADLGEDDPIRLRFTMVRNFLNDIRDNRLSLNLPNLETPIPGQGVHVENLYDEELFHMEDVGLPPEGHTHEPLVFVRLDT
jgi:hypothetical protein